MTRRTQGWGVNDQRVLVEAIENENSIRRKWFQKNKHWFLNNLQTDYSELAKKKLKKLREQKQLEIEEPKINISEKSQQLTPRRIEKDALNYMRPVDPKVLAILYNKNLTSYETQKNYLRERYKTKPEDKFYIRECASWNYGWRLKDFSSHLAYCNQIEDHSMKRTTYQNKLGFKHGPNMLRRPQATHPKNFNDMLEY